MNLELPAKPIVKTSETNSTPLNRLRNAIEHVYEHVEIPYHGLEHVQFVAKKAREFGEAQQEKLGKNVTIRVDLLEPIGLVHDLNHLVERQPNPHNVSVADRTKQLREDLLIKAGYSREDIDKIGRVIDEEEIDYDRKTDPSSWEVKCLRDAGVAYQVAPERKALAESDLFAAETGLTKAQHAKRIITRVDLWRNSMKSLYGRESIFYTDEAERQYGRAVIDDYNEWYEVYLLAS